MQIVHGKDDIESWNSVSLETQLFNQFLIELEQGLRFKDELSSFKQTFTELTVSYDVFDAIKKIARCFLPDSIAFNAFTTPKMLSYRCTCM